MVIDVSPVALPPPHDRVDLAREVGLAVERAGCLVTRICRPGECALQPAGGPAVHVLTFEGRYEPERFACALTVELKPANGGVLTRAHAENPVCPAVDLVKDAVEAGRRACAGLRGSPVATPAPPVAPVAIGAVVDRGPSATRRVLDVGAMVLGATVAAFGIYQALEHGQPAGCATSDLGQEICARSKRRPLAIPLIVLGVAGFGFGVWDISRDDAELAPGLAVRGRF